MGALLFWCVLALGLADAVKAAITGPTHGKVVVCYIGTWAVYRPGRGSFAIENIDPNVCTHLIYSFAGLNVTHDGIRSLDPWQDLPDEYGKNGFERLVKLKDRYPHLKVTLALGGWNEGSTNYSRLAADSARRGRFVANAVEFIRKYNFDGLDLDWEFPGKRGGSPNDKLNFLLLVKEYTIDYMIRLGAKPEKLVMGLPLYGRTFYLPLVDFEQSDGPAKLGDVAKDKGFQGPYTREDGFMGYNEVWISSLM